MSWIKCALVNIDKLGNTISGGNPNSTISARIGYFANDCIKRKFIYYWKFMEFLVDFEFSPIDGPRHCLNAYKMDPEQKHKNGSDLMRVVLGLIIIIGFIPTSILTRLIIIFFPNTKFNTL